MLGHSSNDGEENSERGEESVRERQTTVRPRQYPHSAENSLREPYGGHGQTDRPGVSLVITRPLGRAHEAKGGIDHKGDDDSQSDKVGVNDEKSRSHERERY